MPSWDVLVYCLFVFDSLASNGKKMTKTMIMATEGKCLEQ